MKALLPIDETLLGMVRVSMLVLLKAPAPIVCKESDNVSFVKAGQFFDPRLAEEGKNPFQLDSKAPTADYKAFIESEVRYNRLSRTNPERAEALFTKAAKDAADKYAKLAKMAE